MQYSQCDSKPLLVLMQSGEHALHILVLQIPYPSDRYDSNSVEQNYLSSIAAQMDSQPVPTGVAW